MKRYGDLYSRITDYNNLLLAHENARRGKTWYKEVRGVDRETGIMLSQLQTVIQNGTYRTSRYHIFERQCGSKTRLIYKLPYYPDRIVHHAILQVILPMLVKNLIADTYACVPGRGIHKCAKKIKEVLLQSPEFKYCLKMDIRKFYPSIDHEILKTRVRRIIKCRSTLTLLSEIIDSAETGLPIGNYLSQHLANLYLSGFDHWIKEQKGVKHYYRYSDDLVILGTSKDTLHDLMREISSYLARELKLEVKGNWQVFPVKARGIDFLGYRFYPGYTLLRKSIALKFKHRMRMIGQGNLNPRAMISSFVSYYGWLCHANTLNLRRNHVTKSVQEHIRKACEVMKCKNPMRKMCL